MSSHWAACTRSALWNGLFITFIGLMATMVRGQDDEPEPTDDTRERLVFLTNGRMLTGQVTRNGGGFLIEQSNGRIQVPSDEVKFIAKDLHEAYRKQRDSIAEPTPATHLALANWCISHKLLDDARDELKKCLKANPDNQEARRLLQRLTDTIRSGLPPITSEPVPLKTPDGFLQREAESLGGLSKEAAIQFTSRIQPLLLNKCGNISCHGAASSNKFRLSQARMGSNGSRQNTERNLAEALRYVDLNDTSNSQLLRVLKGSHGGKGTLFVGPTGADQMKQLREWVVSVSHEKNEADRELERRMNLAGKNSPKKQYAKVSLVNHETMESMDEDSNDKLAASDEIRSKPRELKPDSNDAHALALEPIDAFDPEEFNRRTRR